MFVRVSACVLLGLGLAFSPDSSCGQSYPSAETLKLFDIDALGYPGLADQGVEQAINTRASISSGFPPVVPADIPTKIEYWKRYVAEGRQLLEEAQASGVSETILEHYREDIAVGEQRIAELLRALNEPAPDPPPPATTADLFNTPEARAKIQAAKDDAKKALDTASHGQVVDVKPIVALLVNVLSAARQLSLAGIDDPAKELESAAKETLKVFSASFAARCKEQSFDSLFATGLWRQNQINGTDISLELCAYRVLASVSGDKGWRHCGIGIGDWFFRDANPDDGSKSSGTGQTSMDPSSGKFSYHVIGPRADYKLEGRLELQRKEFRISPGGRILGVMWRLTEHRERASGHWGPFSSEVHIEAFPPEMEWDLTILNDNKPCDPSKDVWIYN